MRVPLSWHGSCAERVPLGGDVSFSSCRLRLTLLPQNKEIHGYTQRLIMPPSLSGTVLGAPGQCGGGTPWARLRSLAARPAHRVEVGSGSVFVAVLGRVPAFALICLPPRSVSSPLHILHSCLTGPARARHHPWAMRKSLCLFCGVPRWGSPQHGA